MPAIESFPVQRPACRFGVLDGNAKGANSLQSWLPAASAESLPNYESDIETDIGARRQGSRAEIDGAGLSEAEILLVN